MNFPAAKRSAVGRAVEAAGMGGDFHFQANFGEKCLSQNFCIPRKSETYMIVTAEWEARFLLSRHRSIGFGFTLDFEGVGASVGCRGWQGDAPGRARV